LGETHFATGFAQTFPKRRGNPAKHISTSRLMKKDNINDSKTNAQVKPALWIQDVKGVPFVTDGT
jgi:hypothetical protein